MSRAVPTVNELVERLKADDKTKRFSRADYRDLVFAVLSDDTFKAKKYLFRKDEMFEEEVSYNAQMRKFLDKLLKHAGVSDANERLNILDTFEYSPKDTEWIADAVDEAMSIYVDCGKSMKLFREKMQILSFTKMARSGKYEGRVTFKKSVMDRAAMMAKKEAAK